MSSYVEDMSIYRVRVRGYGANWYHYLDIAAPSPEAATRAAMEQRKSCSEAQCIGLSPPGARNGDCV